MVAVAASEDEVAPLLGEGVDIAAVNGPNSVVISGEGAAVGAVADRLAGRGRRVHRLAVSHAFHSGLMEPMLAQFAQVLAEVSVTEPRIGLVSNVTGQLAGPGYGSPQYWVEHVRRPVRFARGVQTVESLGAGVFVEVGPGGGLTAAVEQSLTTEQGGLGGGVGQGSSRGRVAADRTGSVVHRGCEGGLGWCVRRVDSSAGGVADVWVCAAAILVGRWWIWWGRSVAPTNESVGRLGRAVAAADVLTSSTVSWWSWCACTRQPSWGTRAAMTSISSVLFPTSGSTQ